MAFESLPNDYPSFLHDLKERIRTAQVKAVLSVNREMIALYWDLGRQVVERQRQGRWGTGIIERISRDIMAAFPEIKGFSRSNIQRMRLFYLAWTTIDSIVQQTAGQLDESALPEPTTEIPICAQPVRKLRNIVEKQADSSIVPQPVAQLPWGHNIILIEHLRTPQERLWYAKMALQEGWSRNVLIHQIESGLHRRQGKAPTNFKRTLPVPQSELAQETLKDDYALDFLKTAGTKERDLERGLVNDVQRSLLELGAGFAFVGRQHHLEVGGEDFYIDMLFYHLKLRCYFVIELKTGAFRPEHAGKLSFYLSAVDDLMRHPDDRPSIGMVLCKSKNQVIAEYALRDIDKPIGVASYHLTKALPDALAGRLPTTKELEDQLSGL